MFEIAKVVNRSRQVSRISVISMTTTSQAINRVVKMWWRYASMNGCFGWHGKRGDNRHGRKSCLVAGNQRQLQT